MSFDFDGLMPSIWTDTLASFPWLSKSAQRG